MTHLQNGTRVQTPTGKTGRIVQAGLPEGGVRVMLDPFQPDYAGAAAPRSLVTGLCVVYHRTELQPINSSTNSAS